MWPTLKNWEGKRWVSRGTVPNVLVISCLSERRVRNHCSPPISSHLLLSLKFHFWFLFISCKYLAELESGMQLVRGEVVYSFHNTTRGKVFCGLWGTIYFLRGEKEHGKKWMNEQRQERQTENFLKLYFMYIRFLDFWNCSTKFNINRWSKGLRQ